MTIAESLVGVRTVAAVEVEEFRDQGVVVDRKIMVTLDCGHSKFVGVRLDAPVPVAVGDASRCLACACHGHAAAVD